VNLAANAPAVAGRRAFQCNLAAAPPLQNITTSDMKVIACREFPVAYHEPVSYCLPLYLFCPQAGQLAGRLVSTGRGNDVETFFRR
jgi:hypothetical protein